MLFKPSKNITLVVYEDFKSTKCFQINKIQLKVFLTALPFLLILSILVVIFSLIFVHNTISRVDQRVPEAILALQNEKKTLDDQIVELKQDHENLTQKIASGNSATHSAQDLGLTQYLFKPTLGFKDLSANTPFTLEDFTVTRESNHLKLKFNIARAESDTSSRRISGYILAFMKTANQLNVYPQTSAGFSQSLVTFNQGETFSFSRFRPVEAVFDLPATNKKAFFKVLIFSKSGDLIKKMDYEEPNG